MSPRIPTIPLRKWRTEAAEIIISAASFLVFTFLDLVELGLCFFYRVADAVLEENSFPCYCENRASHGSAAGDGGGEEEEEEEVSETLYGRRNIFREMGLLNLMGRREVGKERGGLRRPRWSDCVCESCVSWQEKGEEKLHFVVKEPSQDVSECCWRSPTENIIFLHGFLSSSSLWVETVFPNLSKAADQNCRLFAVDLLGFGGSPKPTDCLYKLKDHIGMIERTVIKQFQLNSFHLVAHSMGCIIALALASKHQESVKSITLIAPPYFSSPKERASHNALNRLAERRVWPPLLFGSSVMSWYEHLGRSVCFIFCRNHGKWEQILKLLTRRRDIHFMIIDLTRHTHHSAWHTMHNVICGGARLMDEHLEAVNKSSVLVKLIQGDKDQVVPLECSYSMKLKVPLAELQIISDADHNTVILGRERDFTRDLEEIWFSSAKHCKDNNT